MPEFTNRNSFCGEAIPVVMTVAGSDCGGGAGIQADLRTFHALSVFGTSVITALTAQNPLEVSAVSGVSPQLVESQLSAVTEVMDLAAVKTGMLFSEEIIDAAAPFLLALKIAEIPVIVDPVMVATSSAKLLKDDAIDAMQQRIFPAATWITPNIPEAELLCSRSLNTETALCDAAREMGERWNLSVILKGGHAVDSNYARDYVFYKGQLYTLSAKRIPVRPHADHGTGCTFSAALAAILAHGYPVPEALKLAKSFVLASLAESRQIGKALIPLYGMYPVAAFEKYLSGIRLEKI